MTTDKNQTICFCFGYTAGDIMEDVRRQGRSTILEQILSEKKAGACRCAEKNPRGR
ncbi:MAG: BFD-like (2Fe-2S) protein [Desulfobulbaceae bacterium DB1]|nr:MAG: BFD-like (2Fe-2S) protein [Desulfobulbaceae bacterium DB1]